MAKAADISSKRLISIEPTAWVQWLTGDSQARALELLGNELQFTRRVNDALFRVQSTQHGEYLVACEIQLRADARMPFRMRSYVALIEERYKLPVYPVVVNILHTTQPVVSELRTTFMGLSAHQQYRVINLWELDAETVLTGGLPTLLPFVPIMAGGDRVDIVQRAVYALRNEPELADFETFLVFMARFVLDSKTINSIMRWDMATLRENPWYAEILEEGREEGMLAMVHHAIIRRFGEPGADVVERIHRLPPDQLVLLLDVVIDASSLQEVVTHVDAALES